MGCVEDKIDINLKASQQELASRAIGNVDLAQSTIIGVHSKKRQKTSPAGNSFLKIDFDGTIISMKAVGVSNLVSLQIEPSRKSQDFQLQKEWFPRHSHDAVKGSVNQKITSSHPLSQQLSHVSVAVTNDEALFQCIGVLKQKKQGQYQFQSFGTGMLWKNKYVLTSAHHLYTGFASSTDNEAYTIQGFQKNIANIRFQSQNKHKKQLPVLRSIVRTIVHQEYKNHLSGLLADQRIRAEYDLALLQLNQEISVDKEIKIVENVQFQRLAIFGFQTSQVENGEKRQGYEFQQLYGEVGEIYPLKYDKQKRKRQNTIFYLTKGNIGSSGSPILVIDQSTNQYVCIGIHSKFNSLVELKMNIGVYFNTKIMRIIMAMKQKLEESKEDQQEEQKKDKIFSNNRPSYSSFEQNIENNIMSIEEIKIEVNQAVSTSSGFLRPPKIEEANMSQMSSNRSRKSYRYSSNVEDKCFGNSDLWTNNSVCCYQEC